MRMTSRKLGAKMSLQGFERINCFWRQTSEPMESLALQGSREDLAQHSISVVYKLTCMMQTPKCSSRSLVPSYFSMVRLFQLDNKVAFITMRTKGFLYCCNYFLKVFIDMCWVSCLTLTFVARGILCVVDSISLPMSVSSFGCHEWSRSYNYAFSCQRAEIS